MMTQSKAKNTEVKSGESPPKKFTIHFADGNKGGVGKSFLARTLYQYFIDRQMPVLGIEADVNSPDFRGIYPDAAVSCFSEDEALNDQANNILNWTIEGTKNTVVNLPAAVHKSFQLWLDSYNIVELAESAGVGLVKWFVCTGEYDSMKSLGVSLETLGKSIPHVIVKNLKYGDWEFFNEDETTQGLIQQYQCPVMVLPKLPIRIASTILQQRLSFAAAQSYQGKSFGLVQQSAVKGYLRDAYAAFENTGLV
jgi:hypothetical protein